MTSNPEKYSVTFQSQNSWTDWHMISIKRPAIDFPKVKKISVDIPSGNGEIDLTEALTGYPVYENRVGKLKFRLIEGEGYKSVKARRDFIASYLHGKRIRMRLNEEKEFDYYGRFEIDDFSYKGTRDFADITIAYDLDPYKISTHSSIEEYEWDTFDFEENVNLARIFKNISVTSSDNWQYIENLDLYTGDMPVVPTVIVTGGSITCRLFNWKTQSWGSEFTFNAGRSANRSFLFTKNATRLGMKGQGTISFDFKLGRL